MFGNLFEEEEEEGFASATPRGRLTKGGDEPPPPRGRSNLCGIKNQGGTCYLNSLLQTLLFTPEFRGEDEVHQYKRKLKRADSLFIFLHSFFAEELFSLGPEELGCLEDKEKPGAKVSARTAGVNTDVVLVCSCDA